MTSKILMVGKTEINAEMKQSKLSGMCKPEQLYNLNTSIS